MNNKITTDMLPAFQGVIPATLATASKDGIPNVTYISQVYYIDEARVAISHQFFNKSRKNIEENPFFTIALTCPETASLWKIDVQYIEGQKEGEVFDEMDMVITAIGSMYGDKNPFKLQSAVICRVLSIKSIFKNE
ncbi:MAG: putative pyridoxine 5'-phosphate oxidase superfamily flavin-nucleotide-binding protein [Roseivirga sp.]|jgi:predicted pyridoxine 5'-phosphate oxidase superfamily flavin-nucleotide-binding protein